MGSKFYCETCKKNTEIGGYSITMHTHHGSEELFKLPSCSICNSAYYPVTQGPHTHCEIVRLIDFNQYQIQAVSTAIYPGRGNNFIYPAFGLGGETGEVLEKLKKVLRDKDGRIDNTTREALCKELGDVLWYVANLASELKIPLDVVVRTNVRKLFKRQEDEKLHGEGDDR